MLTLPRTPNNDRLNVCFKRFPMSAFTIAFLRHHFTVALFGLTTLTNAVLFRPIFPRSVNFLFPIGFYFLSKSKFLTARMSASVTTFRLPSILFRQPPPDTPECTQNFVQKHLCRTEEWKRYFCLPKVSLNLLVSEGRGGQGRHIPFSRSFSHFFCLLSALFVDLKTNKFRSFLPGALSLAVKSGHISQL